MAFIQKKKLAKEGKYIELTRVQYRVFNRGETGIINIGSIYTNYSLYNSSNIEGWFDLIYIARSLLLIYIFFHGNDHLNLYLITCFLCILEKEKLYKNNNHLTDTRFKIQVLLMRRNKFQK